MMLPPTANGVDKGAKRAFVAYALPLVFWIVPVMVEALRETTKNTTETKRRDEDFFMAWRSHQRGRELRLPSPLIPLPVWLGEGLLGLRWRMVRGPGRK